MALCHREQQDRCCPSVGSSRREILGSAPRRAQPRSLAVITMSRTLDPLAAVQRRKVRMTARPHGPYVQGYTRATLDGTNSWDPARGAQHHHDSLSTDWSLQLHAMKLVALVITAQHAAANTSSAVVQTAGHHTGVDWSRSAWAIPLWEAAS